MLITDFTPGSALTGGVLIGLGSALLWWANGRIAGVSGIFHGLIGPGAAERAWRALFLLGLVIGGGAWLWLAPPAFEPREGFSLWRVAIAGALVGIGTLAGGGCTSGHGVCGLGRLSLRSLAAVITFMLTAGIVVFAARRLTGTG